MVASSIVDIIGNTPLVQLDSLKKDLDFKARVLAKLEFLNPAGSIKDRVALSMIRDAEAQGTLLPGGCIIEPTSGNTGIGLAALGAALGYRVIIVMPESMSGERRKLVKAYGAELVLTKASEGMKGTIAKAAELHKEIPDSCILGQFVNKANPKAHFERTGPEIWQQCQGKIDFFVAGVGTGGTITGAGSFLKKKNPDLKIIAVEPLDSPVLSGGQAGPHKIQGIGAGFVPEILDVSLINEIYPVSTEQAYTASHLLAYNEGILTGISSGAALACAILLAEKEENADKSIVVILPDSGDRYLSTELFVDQGL